LTSVKDDFSLKYRSSPFLVSDGAYTFTCPCNTGLFYLGETDRHIGIRGNGHLDLEKSKVSAVGVLIQNCEEFTKVVCFSYFILTRLRIYHDQKLVGIFRVSHVISNQMYSSCMVLDQFVISLLIFFSFLF